jgi:AraC-like DNA-binding protein
MLSRPPLPALRPFVSQLWASESEPASSRSGPAREHALPTGAMHIVFRLNPEPLRLFRSSDDAVGYTVGHALVGGVRSAHYIRDVSSPSCAVGAILRPGAAELLFRASAEEFAERHTQLDCLWSDTDAIHAQLTEARTLEQRLVHLENALLSRLPKVHGLHPAVAVALEHFDGMTRVQTVVEHTGYSHRRFIAQFRRAVGLTPKTYLRVQRFQQALVLAHDQATPDWSQIAAELGFTDQSHLIRDFKAFAGITPEQYRLAKPISPNHVPR